MTIPDPYSRRLHRGVLMDEATIALVTIAEIKLGYELTIVQGVGTATASGGSHRGKIGADGKWEGGRAIDITAWDGARKDKVLKDLGFIGWQRDELPGVWGPHGHYVNVLESDGNARGIDPVALRQIPSYRARRNGLVSNLPDNSYRAPGNPVFTLEEYRRFHEGEGAMALLPPTNVSRARNRIGEALHSTRQAIALLKDTEGRPVAEGQIDELQEVVANLKTRLEKLPAR